MVNFLKEIVPVVILAGGRATRLQPLSDSIPKSLIPIAGKPLIGRILEGFRAEGFFEFIIVLSPNSKKVQEYVLNWAKNESKLKISFITQNEPKGMVDAIQFKRVMVECNKTNKRR